MALNPLYRAQAAEARAQADLATLDNVRERCLRAEAAFLALAERQERIEKARVERTPGRVEAALERSD